MYDPAKRLPALLILQHDWFLNLQPNESFQSSKNLEHSSTPPCTPKFNGSNKSMSDSKIRKMLMPSKWSLVLDMKNQTWNYELFSDIKKLNSDSKCNSKS